MNQVLRSSEQSDVHAVSRVKHEIQGTKEYWFELASRYAEKITHLEEQYLALSAREGWQPIETAPKGGGWIILARFGKNEAGTELGMWWKKGSETQKPA